MKIGSLVVEIAADSSKFDSATAKTTTSLDALSKKATDAVGTFTKYSAAAAAAGGAIAAALYVKASQAIDAQAKLAQRLNTTSESMATLERAGGLSGVAMEKVAQGSGDLTRRLSQAATMGGPVKDALDSIGLSAEQLQSIPLDQRIEKINQALLENADASQRAAIAGQLFGEEGALFMTQINPDVLAQARKETELFGLALSDVDAAKVEMANDAFSTFGMAADGIVQQLTVQLAPIVKAISDEFVNAADEAGGFGNVAIDAFEKVINVAAFVADAADGIKRTFQLTADGIIVAINSAMAKVSEIIADVLEGMSKIPGVDFSETVNSLNSFAATSESIVDQAWSSIDDTLAKPFAGEALRQFVDDARVAGEAAAQAAIEGRAAVQEGGQAAGGLSPEAQKAQEELAARIESIRQANLTEMELLLEKQAMEMEAINAHEELKLSNYQEWADLMLETKLRHEDELTAIEEKAAAERNRVAEEEARNRQQVQASLINGLTGLMNSGSKTMFEIGKAAALSQAAVDGYAAITGAYKVGASIGGPAVGAAYGAAAALATANQINAIRSQSFGGGGGAVSAPSATQAVNAQTEPVNSQQAPSQTMYVSGFDPKQMYGGDLIEYLLDYQRDGGNIVLA